MNRVTLMGRLGAHPDVRAMNSGDRVANIRIATEESWRDKSTGERKTATEWHNVVIFNEGLVKVAEKYLQKGNRVIVEGTLRTRKWQDRQGADRYSTEVIVPKFGGSIEIIDWPDKDDTRSPQQRHEDALRDEPTSRHDDLDDDIPF